MNEGGRHFAVDGVSRFGSFQDRIVCTVNRHSNIDQVQNGMNLQVTLRQMARESFIQIGVQECPYSNSRPIGSL